MRYGIFLIENTLSQTLVMLVAQHIGLVSCSAHRRRCGNFGVRFLSRISWTQCRLLLATTATFLQSCVAQALSRGDRPATRFALGIIPRV